MFNVDSPPAPRNDLVTIFLTGIPGLNQPADVRASEMLRLNMAIPPSASPHRLGVLGGDLAGFPNGRRVGDDVLDIVLQAAAGATPLTPAFLRSPNNMLGDGVERNDVPYLTFFPYLGYPSRGEQIGGCTGARVHRVHRVLRVRRAVIPAAVVLATAFVVGATIRDARETAVAAALTLPAARADGGGGRHVSR